MEMTSTAGTVPLDPELATALLQWKGKAYYTGADDYVFAGEAGKARWQAMILKDHILPAADEAKIGKVGWHTFRHTYRTWLDSTGAPVAMQRELMRHASIETTMNVYGRATMSDAKRQANSKVVRMALRPVLSTKAESGASEKAPPIKCSLILPRGSAAINGNCLMSVPRHR